MGDVDNQFTLCKGPFQSILINETHFHNDANVKEILNCHVLQKNTNSSTTHIQILKGFANFVEN